MISCPFVETGSSRFRFRRERRSIIRDREVSPSAGSLIKFRGRRRSLFSVSTVRFVSVELRSLFLRLLLLLPIGRSLLQPLLTPPLAQRDEARSHQRIMTARRRPLPSPPYSSLLLDAVSCLATREWDLSKHDIRSGGGREEEEEEDVARP